MTKSMTKEEIVNIIEISHRHIDKKYANDPSYVIRKRVANTAGDVIKIVNDLSFSELATDVYLVCRLSILFFKIQECCGICKTPS